MADVKITIENGTITVDKSKIKVKKGSETVNWKCSDQTYNIVFKPGSEWPNPQTQEQGGKWVAESGPFPNTGSLFYGITAPGAKSLDPEIEIVP
jgi:hypothetical protein